MTCPRSLAFCLAVLSAAVLTTGCRRGEDKAAAAAAPQVVQIGRDGVVTVTMQEILTGPAISGQLAAEEEATVRAKVGGSIVSLPIEEGQTVARGTVLARIEARDLNDAAESARVQVRSAQNAVQLARNELQRTETLVQGGALAERDLDNARNALANVESQLAAAQARLASTTQQVSDTVVRSPLGGVVSDKAANEGDVVQPGAAIATVINPRSMRLEASVPSDRIGELRVGATVNFEVRGYPGQTFEGRLARISPAADPATRQVRIFVSIPNTAGRLISGLFAEGRVTAQRRQALVLPQAAIDVSGPSPAVTRVRDGKTERVDVQLGLRDPETERVEVVSGLTDGDIVLTGPSRGIAPGTPVKVATDSGV